VDHSQGVTYIGAGRDVRGVQLKTSTSVKSLSLTQHSTGSREAHTLVAGEGGACSLPEVGVAYIGVGREGGDVRGVEARSQVKALRLSFSLSLSLSH